MYDRPETAEANDRFWKAIQDNLETDRIALSRTGDPWDHWTDPDLILSQTCGLPYRTSLHQRTTYIGTPDYGLPRCPPGYYNSVLISRAADDRRDLSAFKGARLAINSHHSQSGWAAPINAGALPGQIIETGAHRSSAESVATGSADFAAIDAQTWRMIDRWDDVADELRIILRTVPTPGLPFIASSNVNPVPLRAAVVAAISTLSREDRDILNIRALVQIPLEDYLAVETPSAD